MGGGLPDRARADGAVIVNGRGPGRLGRVLLAEADPSVAQPLAAALRRSGFCVFAEPTGRRALERLCAAAFDLVITDIVMPEMDGLDLLSWLRRLQADVPAIALTGDGPDAGALYAKAALCLGADLTLAKTVAPSALLAAAHRLTAHGRGVPGPIDVPVPAA